MNPDLFVLTGFLGSGKSTLLNGYVATPGLTDTAVVVNEFGEIGLDHHLIEASDEATVVLKGGCVCCTVREDLAATLGRLKELVDEGQIPAFRRVVIETSGLADPVPVVLTLLSDPRVANHYCFRGVVAVFDAECGLESLTMYNECRRQLLYADRVVITKIDRIGLHSLKEVRRTISAINPGASVVEAPVVKSRPALLFENLPTRPGHPSDAESLEQWLGIEDISSDNDISGHVVGFASVSWTFEHELDWTAFGIWLTMLLHAHGDRILRVKGVINVREASNSVAIHGVQHVVYPPVHLKRPKSSCDVSRLVFIYRDMDPDMLRRSFRVFMSLNSRHGGPDPSRQLPIGAGRTIGGRPYRLASAPAWIKG